ncbi:M4 family metallopeptidase [Zeaxanthinibacter enoshimensis]|uniref:Neutral metalloproteinase n=1 Tax=Zeaxanthinibacter enoshimensis TaxID=392009 RepID=A0A4R6TLK7_9FLAO|nr:M4 family metallopeptidase [Zeaxanthinibacter enoshimensis]TDQ31392.1 thermolysin metallopeptidase-like protein [Zeaxanthinibacter enoshimensis]
MCTAKTCFIIPPHILEALAKQGNISCKKALNDTKRILSERNEALNYLLLRTEAEKDGERFVYDSQGQYKQRVELSRTEDGEPSGDTVVNQAFETSGFVRDYFENTFGLNSINNMGMPVISNVHYGKAYNNAYWDGDEMTYGDGDGIEFKNFASAIDVVAHELTHGVTQFLANLEYEGQPGALNEHFSDVFATIVKQKYFNQSIEEADWLIGDSIVTPAFPGTAIRSLKEPGSANDFDRQPAHMDKYYNGPDDRYGVHINSGIPNRAFYLCCQEIGIEQASLIWYHTLKKLWRTSNFQDMVDIISDVTQKLASEGRVSDSAPAAVSQSFRSVGLETQLV